jgi:L-ascorbate metabolism protein UlaG (beta-lactamase superfamily)
MKHRVLVRWVCVVMLLVGADAAAADRQGDAIAAALDAARPALPMTDARAKALQDLDAWIARPGSEHMQPVVDYYQAAVDRALKTLEQERIASGVRIFQLYSSSVVVQTPETVFAFDLTLGGGRPFGGSASEQQAWVHMNDAQVARLAKLVDYSFHTHEHGDHVNASITEALLKAGKAVIVTKSNKVGWSSQPWGEKLTALNQTVKTPVSVGPLRVDVLWDHQWGSEEHTSGTPCNAYVITTPRGMTVMSKGDINCGLQLYGWLSLLKQRGQRVDVIVGSPIFWRGVDTMAQWNALFSPLWLPGHTWEFGHRRSDQPQGNCMAFVQSWKLVRDATGSEKVQPLSWGEWIDVPEP